MKRKFLRYGIVAVLTAVFLSSVAAYALTPDIGEYYRTMGLAEEITYPTAREKKVANIRGINNNEYCHKAGLPTEDTMFWSTIMKNDGTTAATSVHKNIYQGERREMPYLSSAGETGYYKLRNKNPWIIYSIYREGTWSPDDKKLM